MARIARSKKSAARRSGSRKKRVAGKTPRPKTRTTADAKRTTGAARHARKVIALFPEAAFGPALNSVGIGQALEKLGHKAVFLSDPGFLDVYKGYGFEAYAVNLSEPMAPEDMARFWVDFINGQIPNFRKSPYEQVGNYVKDCWSMIVETAKWAEKDLPAVLASVKPDVICVDNVILFPAIKRYAREHGKPWIRIISCSENEIEDPDIPPHLSGCEAGDRRGHARYRKHFNEVIAPIHGAFNEFLESVGEKKYRLGQFFEASPHMNLLLYPSAVRFKRRRKLPPRQFQYLEGCVRKEQPYTVPRFRAHGDKPLLYVSFGSLGAGDTALLKRLIAALGQMPLRALVNVGDYLDQYTDVPPNVIVDRWFPQPSVIPKVDAVIHHGGNNSFTECLYFGKPALILPYVWDGHDNATRVQETGHGFRLDRYDWTDDELRDRIARMLTDRSMKARLARTSKAMRARHGPTKAARVIDAVARRRGLKHGRRNNESRTTRAA
jgi:MGT family glycosyltransferase